MYKRPVGLLDIAWSGRDILAETDFRQFREGGGEQARPGKMSGPEQEIDSPGPGYIIVQDS